MKKESYKILKEKKQYRKCADMFIAILKTMVYIENPTR